MFASPVLDEIQRLDPVKDHQRIVFLSTRYDFPFDTTRALELALFRTYGVPSISALLDHTGEFQHRSDKRYEDTDIIVSELMEWGYDSDRGKRTLRRMNQLHGRFQISNDDFLYVLSTFVFEPIRWNRRFGWRLMCEQERLGLFHFWAEVGKRMNIKDIPADYDAFERFTNDYERQHYKFAECNRRVGTATREMFVRWLPRPFAPLVRTSIHSLLDEPLMHAFGFPQPTRFMRWLVPTTLRIRAGFLRWFPRRKKPVLRTEKVRSLYPAGYLIEDLGPPATQNAK